MEKDRKERALIAAGFWWAEGHEALEQDWERGDFSTWIDRNIQCQAFGVEFELEGIKAMLTPERAAALARELSVTSKVEWVAANEARRQLYMSNFTSPTTAEPVLLDHCRLGFVAARAVLMEQTLSTFQGQRKREEREWDIPEWYWQEFTKSGSSAQDWSRGVFNGRGSAPEGISSIKLTGVYFLQPTLPHVGKGRSKDEPEPLSKDAKGRPSKPWWDDFWCAIWGQVYRGELIPKRQSDVERAMHQWITDHGHDASESTVKPLARKLFAEYQADGNK